MKNERTLSSLAYHLKTIGIDQYLHDNNVTEIMLNPNGELWVERFGQPCVLSHTITNDAAQNLINSIASSCNTTIDTNNPILECELITDGSRFEGIMPPVVANVSFTLRKKAIKVFTLEDYLNSNILSKKHYDYIIQCIKKHKNIVVVGGTASGKTTLVNAILAKMAELFPDERHVVLEDTNELQPTAKNCVVMRTHPKAGIGMRELLRATLRYRPDRIIVGEVRGGEALELLKAWNTGHEGGVLTIHANSGSLGLERLEQCIAEVSASPYQRMIASTVDILIFITKSNDGRKINEICEVTDFDNVNGKYITTNIQR
jgi:type IV secretion system protein VirB11